jgi:biotin/methionine sulfoxide reductase
VSRANKVQDREPLLIHPDDAAARGIADGAVVRVCNERGACLAGVRVTDAIRPGVVQLATGAWYDPEVPGTPPPVTAFDPPAGIAATVVS